MSLAPPTVVRATFSDAAEGWGMVGPPIRGRQPRTVIQVWCDPRRREVHRDPALLEYLAGVAERHGMAAMIRYGPREGFILAAPSISGNGGWLKLHGNVQSQEVIDQMLKQVGVAERFVPQ